MACILAAASCSSLVASRSMTSTFLGLAILKIFALKMAAKSGAMSCCAVVTSRIAGCGYSTTILSKSLRMSLYTSQCVIARADVS